MSRIMIAGLGVDLVDVRKMGRFVERKAFVKRVFTLAEAAACRAAPSPAECFARKFAVKEAFLKALGLGIGSGVRLAELTVTSTPSGVPVLSWGKATERVLTERGIAGVQASVSTEGHVTVGLVVLEGRSRAR